jgi:hypothetical protein
MVVEYMVRLERIAKGYPEVMEFESEECTS